jgi:hypothetical protein
MDERLREVLSLAESNTTWLDDAAQHFEQFAAQLHGIEKAQWQLLAAVYRERAQAIQSEAEKVRESLETDGPSELGSQDTSAPSD